jgi:biotin operon repressor
MSDVAYWAARQQPSRPLDKLVLLAFADRADKASGECFPSVAWLVEWTGCDRKTVMKSTASLEAAGLLIDTGMRRGRTLQVKVYRLPFETVPIVAPLPGETVPETAPFEPAKSTVFPFERSQKRDTEPLSEPLSQKTSSSSKKGAREAASFVLPGWVPTEAWDGWLEMRRAKGAKPTARALNLSVEQLRKLADAGHPPGEVLDQSTRQLWLGLFPIKEMNDGLSQRNEHAAGSRHLALAGPRRGFGTDMLAAALARPEDDSEGDPRDCWGAEGEVPAYLRRRS